MIVTLGSTKGGVGKSTLALQLALARTRAGHATMLVDADRQQTLWQTACVRRAAVRTPEQGCLAWPEARELQEGLPTLADEFEDVIVDVGGHDNAALRMALLMTDLLLVPVQPRSLDLWALHDLMLLVTRAQAVRHFGGHQLIKGASVLNMADPQGRDNQLTRETIEEFEAIPPLAVSIKRRKAFATATASGLSVKEQPSPDRLAVAEIEALAEELFAIRAAGQAA